jgi:hypothetical protein
MHTRSLSRVFFCLTCTWSSIRICRLDRLIGWSFFILLSSASKLESKEIYPEIHARKIEYKLQFCTAIKQSTQTEEIYIVEDKKFITGKPIKVVEFFSGKNYQGIYKEKLKINKNNILTELTCGATERSVVVGAKHPINELGEYFSVMNVDTSGNYGANVIIDNCQIGSDCDFGTQGLALISKSGETKWAKLIALQKNIKFNHPTYYLPELLTMRDGVFDKAILLKDDSILLGFNEHGVIRLLLTTGDSKSLPSSFAVVSLNDWANLKHILSKRFLNSTDNCKHVTQLNCEWQRKTEMYFYTLQNFLFPNSGALSLQKGK